MPIYKRIPILLKVKWQQFNLGWIKLNGKIR